MMMHALYVFSEQGLLKGRPCHFGVDDYAFSLLLLPMCDEDREIIFCYYIGSETPFEYL